MSVSACNAPLIPSSTAHPAITTDSAAMPRTTTRCSFTSGALTNPDRIQRLAGRGRCTFPNMIVGFLENQDEADFFNPGPDSGARSTRCGLLFPGAFAFSGEYRHPGQNSRRAGMLELPRARRQFYLAEFPEARRAAGGVLGRAIARPS